MCDYSKLVPIRGKERETLYIAMNGTGVPVVTSETVGRKGKQPDGNSKTREAKLGCVFTQTSTDDEGKPIRDADSTTYVGAIETAENLVPAFIQNLLLEEQTMQKDLLL